MLLSHHIMYIISCRKVVFILDDIEPSLGLKLHQARKAAGLKQIDVSEILKNIYGSATSRETISKWETGFQTPSLDSISKLAQIYGVSLDSLFVKDEITPPEPRMNFYRYDNSGRKWYTDQYNECFYLDEDQNPVYDDPDDSFTRKESPVITDNRQWIIGKILSANDHQIVKLRTLLELIFEDDGGKPKLI